jgi:hypothetical protein
MPRLIGRAREIEGVDLVLWREGEEGVIARGDAELRFAPGGDVADARGETWSVEGDVAAVLGAGVEDGRLVTSSYPDALGRAWSALTCPTAGDVLLSAAPAYEFLDWGGVGHVGGGSHGSLHAADSLAPLLWCGTGPDSRDARGQWTLRDVTPMVAEHFAVASKA